LSKSSDLTLPNGCPEKLTLMGLERQDPLLDRVAGNQSVNQDRILLADPVGSVGGLVLYGGVPPRIEDVDVVCRGQIETDPSCLERQKENAWTICPLKISNHPFSINGSAIDTPVGHSSLSKGGLHEIEERGPLREDEGAMSLLNRSLQRFEEEPNLTRR
jgi:hypothetical protein